MSTENEKKGFFERLFGENKPKKSSCCGNMEFEEIPEESVNDQDKMAIKEKSGGSSCK